MSKLPYISFKNVSFGFEEEQVLKRLSFEVRPGKHIVLKGESGSGKSTIFKLLLGFLTPSQGSITFDNNGRSSQFHSIRRYTAWLPQDLNLGTGTVSEVMAKPFEFAANKSEEKNLEHKAKILQKLGLERQTLDKQFRNLSTGQRQRVGLAICHLLDKPLMLLDEPTSALDSVSKQKAADILLNNKERTIISTSHDPFWVDLADKIIELD